MSEEAWLIHTVASGIKNWWHVLTGCTLALWWMLVHVKRRLQDPVIRRSQLEACRVSVVDCIREHEEEEKEAHAAINDKLDNLTSVVIKHLDK